MKVKLVQREVSGRMPYKISTGSMDFTILHKECVDSTNEEAKRGGDTDALHGTVYLADEQTAGKGRRGRSWLSESKENLYFTVLLRPKLAPGKVTMLTLVMAYAVAVAVEAVTGLQAGIKWPNDIVIKNKKVCGILSEMKLEKQMPAYCVIGVGMNIGQTHFPEDLQDKATSLWLEQTNNTGDGHLRGREQQLVDKATLLREILVSFAEAYEAFLEVESLAPILETYNAHLINQNRTVRVLEPGNEFEGTALGVTSTGELLVEKSDKTIQKVYAGEVSVRGLYGYV